MALEQILAWKRDEVARRKADVSLEALLAGARPSDRDFEGPLRAGRPGFILEVKSASPSAGVIRAASDLDPVVQAYGRHADAISVLTDEHFFHGSLERLAWVRERVRQPVLCKDFIVDPFQVAEARRFGADAVLLVLAALDDAAWRASAELAGRLRMAVLTEAHDEAELRRAIALDARIVGINNRDLHTLEVDLGTVRRLAPLLPADRLVVAESGFASRADLAGVRPWVDAVLVGGALMRESDIDRAVRELVYGRTKVCGLTEAGGARDAHQSGATYGGLVFAEASPRVVTVERAAQVRAAAPLHWVGVFAGHAPEEVAAAARHLGLAAVQLHGGEAAAVAARVGELVPDGCEVWKAMPAEVPLPHRTEYHADRLLFDGGARDRFGGTGRSFDWHLLDGYAERGEVVLAGGLTPENVANAAALGTWGLDVSSGVEASPGVKDRERLAAFFAARRRLPGRGDG